MDWEEGARLWAHGLLIDVIILIFTTIFAFFGLALSFATLGGSVASLSAMLFVIVAFIVLPMVFGWASRFLSDLLHDVTVSDIDGTGDWVMLWLHGLGLVVAMLLIATFFGFFGFVFSFQMLMTALTDVVTLFFAVVSILLLPILYGFASKGLTELTT